jgi:hypothetical protein
VAGELGLDDAEGMLLLLLLLLLMPMRRLCPAMGSISVGVKLPVAAGSIAPVPGAAGSAAVAPFLIS